MTAPDTAELHFTIDAIEELHRRLPFDLTCGCGATTTIGTVELFTCRHCGTHILPAVRRREG
jgi:hypothetical protein